MRLFFSGFGPENSVETSWALTTYVGMLKFQTEIDAIFRTYRINKRIITC